LENLNNLYAYVKIDLVLYRTCDFEIVTLYRVIIDAIWHIAHAVLRHWRLCCGSPVWWHIAHAIFRNLL